MTEEVDFNQQLDKFNKTKTQLAPLKVKIEEEDKALFLLASLSSSFDNIVIILLFGKEALKFDDVIATLLMNTT